MTTFFDIIGTSTPVSEVLAEKLGYVRAAIACRVFFYQQLESGVCSASVATLAKKLGMSAGTVSTNLKWLRENGYVKTIGQHKSGNVTNKYKVDKKFYDTLSGKHSADEIEHSLDESNIQQMNGEEDLKEGIKEPVTSNEVSPPQKSSKKAQSKTKPPIKEKDKPKHPPAVDTYRSVANRFPDKATWPLLEEVTDLEFWEKVVRDYIACGWNKINIKTMVEFYKRRELPAAKKNGASNGYQKQSSITGLSKKADTIVKLADPTTGRTYWYDNINKCEVPEPL